MIYLTKIIAIFVLVLQVGCKKNDATDLRSHEGAAEALPSTTPDTTAPTPTPTGPITNAPKTLDQLLALLPIFLTAGKLQALALLTDKPELKPLVEEIYSYLIDNIKLLSGARDPSKSAEELLVLIKKWIKPPLKESDEATFLASATAAFTELQSLAKQNPPPNLFDFLAATLKIIEAVPGEAGDNLRKVVSVDAIKVFLAANPKNEAFLALLKMMNLGSPADLLNLLNKTN